MLGRGATIVSPFIVVALFKGYGVPGVIALMIGLLVVQIVWSGRSASSRGTVAWKNSKVTRRRRRW